MLLVFFVFFCFFCFFVFLFLVSLFLCFFVCVPVCLAVCLFVVAIVVAVLRFVVADGRSPSPTVCFRSQDSSSNSGSEAGDNTDAIFGYCQQQQ